MRYNRGEAFVRVLLDKTFAEARSELASKVFVGVLQASVKQWVTVALPPLHFTVSPTEMVEAVRQVCWDTNLEIEDLYGILATYQIDYDPRTQLAVARTVPALIQSPEFSLPHTVVVSLSDPLESLDLDSFTLPPYYDHGLDKKETALDLQNYLWHQTIPQLPVLDKPSFSCIFCGSFSHVSSGCSQLEGLDSTLPDISVADESGQPAPPPAPESPPSSFLDTVEGFWGRIWPIPKRVLVPALVVVVLALACLAAARVILNQSGDDGQGASTLLGQLFSATDEGDAIPRPAIIERREWDRGQSDPPPDYQALTPEYVTVVHTGTDYPSEPIPQFLAWLSQWERESLEYVDLDSHFYVDREGHIYEARPLSAQGEIGLFDEKGHILVHAIGNYEEEQPSDEMLDALADLIAWLCSEYDIPVEDVGGAADWNPTCSSPGQYLESALEPDGYLKTTVEALLDK
jgi:hypothetical protein